MCLFILFFYFLDVCVRPMKERYRTQRRQGTDARLFSCLRMRSVRQPPPSKRSIESLHHLYCLFPENNRKILTSLMTRTRNISSVSFPEAFSTTSPQSLCSSVLAPWRSTIEEFLLCLARTRVRASAMLFLSRFIHCLSASTKTPHAHGARSSPSSRSRRRQRACHVHFLW